MKRLMLAIVPLFIITGCGSSMPPMPGHVYAVLRSPKMSDVSKDKRMTKKSRIKPKASLPPKLVSASLGTLDITVSPTNSGSFTINYNDSCDIDPTLTNGVPVALVSPPVWSGAVLSMICATQTNKIYECQMTTNQTVWSRLARLDASTNGPGWQIDITTEFGPAAFFRIRSN